MTITIGGAISAEAAAVYAQNSAEDSFRSSQKDTAINVAELREEKEAAKKERKELLAKNEALLRELAYEEGGLEETLGFMGRNQGDVSQDIHRNAIEQQKVSTRINELQKSLGTELKDQQDHHETYSQAQQGFQEMLEIIGDMRSAASDLE